MKNYLRHLVAKLAESDVFTHTLPYPDRFRARRG
jgi:hypothetical protein